MPIHREEGDLVQRMVNFLQPGTYIGAHQHPRVGASETLLVMSGSLGFATFSPEGRLLTTHRLEVGGLIDIEAGVWHSVLALAEDTVILEIKRGPFDAEDKVFAEWAPGENTDEAPAYLAWLTGLFEEPER